MRVLVVYGTSEGHTKHLCEFVQQTLKTAGHEVESVEAGPEAPDPDPFDKVFLAASVHVGKYQTALVDYASRHHQALNSKPSAFVSVSLSAAGDNPDDWRGLSECVARFQQHTSWTPRQLHHAAGAIRYSHYGVFKRLALKFIVRMRGKPMVATRDHDLTDYEALKSFALAFVGNDR